MDSNTAGDRAEVGSIILIELKFVFLNFLMQWYFLRVPLGGAYKSKDLVVSIEKKHLKVPLSITNLDLFSLSFFRSV